MSDPDTDPPAEDGDLPEEGDLPEDEAGPVSQGGTSRLDDVDVRELLRGALRPPPGAVAPPLLSGVQKKLRARSRGKFYGDGWSTAKAPRSTYLVTSILMLVLVVLVLFVLIPWSSAALP